MKYYVERRLHNAETDGYDYQRPTKFDTLDEAQKEAAKIMSTYINYGKLDRVSVLIYDDMNNVFPIPTVWEKPIEPEPIVLDEPEEPIEYRTAIEYIDEPFEEEEGTPDK